jgi:hypothetical protein
MFSKLFSALTKIRKVLSVIAHFMEVVTGVLEAAKASGYRYPVRTAT